MIGLYFEDVSIIHAPEFTDKYLNNKFFRSFFKYLLKIIQGTVPTPTDDFEQTEPYAHPKACIDGLE